MAKHPSIGQYLIRQLHQRGVRHIFGVPGDYVLRLYALVESSPVHMVGTCREDGAGFAADAYARINGLGAACVTYCVGGLNLTNPIAGAYAEKSPVVVISGAPGLKERERNPLLHHRVRDFSTQRDIFAHITVAHTAIEDPLTAYHEIDRVLDAVERYKRPGYIEVPRDMVDVTRRHRRRRQDLAELTEPDSLAECMGEAVRMVNSAKQPVVLAGVEVHRFGLQDQLIRFVEKKRIPVAATLLGKSVIRESHPLYIGVYEGAMGRASVQEFVESSDCVIMLGAFMSDINLGAYTADLDQSRTIYATSERVSIKRHSYDGVPFRSFMAALLEAKVRARRKPALPKHPAPQAGRGDPGAAITVTALFRYLNGVLAHDTIVVSDVGDCLFGSVDLTMHQRTEFLSPAYYTSMGFGVPAAVGAQMASPKSRAIVLVGDGAFQMTGMELSTCARLGLNPIVVVLNNRGYSTERQIADGPFNDIHEWAHDRIPDVLGAGRGFVVNTVGDLHEAMQASLANHDSFSIVDVRLDPYDKSAALARLGEKLSKKV